MKKLAFSLSILAASLSAQAELTELADFDLTNVTGQAGVDIELDLAIDIGSIAYQDTSDGLDGDGGSLFISGIHIGGGAGRTSLLGFPVSNNTANIDRFKFVIDVVSDGDLVISGIPTNTISPVDFLVTADEVYLTNASGQKGAILVDQFSVYGGVMALEMRLDSQTNVIGFSTSIGIDDMDMDLSSMLGLSIENAVVAGGGYFEKIANNRTPDVGDRTAEIYFEMEARGDGMKIDFTKGLAGENVLDIDMPIVNVGGSLIGAIAIDNLDFGGVTLNVAGH